MSLGRVVSFGRLLIALDGGGRRRHAVACLAQRPVAAPRQSICRLRQDRPSPEPVFHPESRSMRSEVANVNRPSMARSIIDRSPTARLLASVDRNLGRPWCPTSGPPWCLGLFLMVSASEKKNRPVFLCIRVGPLGSAPSWVFLYVCVGCGC
jgi:hypothetical protein